MRRSTFYLFMVGMMTCSISASADNLITIDGIAKGITPDGSKVVGQKGLWDDAVYTSFLYNVANDKIDWLTKSEYMGSHLDGGQFTAINDAGIIAGTIRNPDMRMPTGGGGGFKPATRNFSDDEEGEAVSSAAVWRDGKVYILGCGPYTIESFCDLSDGSAATGISADGHTVFGHIRTAYMPVEACVWEYDAATDTYEYCKLATPAKAQMSSMVANASEGYPAAGAYSVPTSTGGMMLPIIWLSADEYVTLDVPNSEGATAIFAHAISADGRYVSISVAGNHPKFFIYDITEGTYQEVNLPVGTTEVTGYTLNNSGNTILKIQDSTWKSSMYFYDYASGTVVTIYSYLEDALPDFDFTGKLGSNTQFIATTGDGKNLLVRPEQYNSSTWLLIMDNPGLVAAPAPDKVDIYHTSPNSVEVKFDGIESLPKGCELAGYKVYINGKEIKTIDATKTGGTYYAESENGVGSSYSATVSTLYKKNGEDKESAKSTAVSTYVSSKNTLINFYDFDDSTVDGQGNINWDQDTWQARTNYGIAGEFINWHLSMSDFENRTPSVNAISAATEPWSTVFESHYMDASKADNFFIDLRYMLKLVNSADQDLSSDYLEVEVTTNGRDWTPVATLKGSEVKPYVWHTLHTDLGKELAGKVFRIRLNAHGEGVGQVSWTVDDIAIGDKLDGAQPDGLRYAVNAEGVKVMWKNAHGVYDVSHLDNSGILWDYNVGNEGKPLIGAIDLTSEQINSFIGEYITGISTFLYDDPTIPQTSPTTAEAIVYADGKEVTRARFESDFNTVSQAVAWLDHPVAIEKGKTYRVGIRISDYATEQAPMYYQAASTSVAGRTDLYSEDEGKTWHNASEIAISDVNPNGYCVWPIRAYISAEPESAKSENQVLYYDIFRDGVKINEGNIYEPRTWFAVANPFAGIYTLQAHYAGGSISPLSEPLDLTKVEGIEQVRFTLGVTTGHGTVIINGECEGAILYDMSGRVVASTSGNELHGIAAGVYMLQAYTEGRSETYKIIVK